MTEYKNYDDWYDNGPGSENMNRRIAQSSINYRQEEHQRKCAENRKKQEEIDSMIRRDKKQQKEIKTLKEESRKLKKQLKELKDTVNKMIKWVPAQELY